MKFRILIHKKAYEFLKDLKLEDKQRIVYPMQLQLFKLLKKHKK